MPPLEFGLAELDFDGGEFSLQDADEEVPAAAGWLQETRVDAVCLVLDQVEHGFDHPRRGEHLTVVGNAFF